MAAPRGNRDDFLSPLEVVEGQRQQRAHRLASLVSRHRLLAALLATALIGGCVAAVLIVVHERAATDEQKRVTLADQNRREVAAAFSGWAVAYAAKDFVALCTQYEGVGPLGWSSTVTSCEHSNARERSAFQQPMAHLASRTVASPNAVSLYGDDVAVIYGKDVRYGVGASTEDPSSEYIFRDIPGQGWRWVAVASSNGSLGNLPTGIPTPRVTATPR